jgi:hypothetical protein
MGLWPDFENAIESRAQLQIKRSSQVAAHREVGRTGYQTLHNPRGQNRSAGQAKKSVKVRPEHLLFPYSRLRFIFSSFAHLPVGLGTFFLSGSRSILILV